MNAPAAPTIRSPGLPTGCLPTYRKELTEVGRGTPMGELLRRYTGIRSDWSRDAGDHAACRARAGRGPGAVSRRAGQAGLLHARCAHRGTTLYYGRVEPGASAAVITAGCSTSRGAASTSPASPAAGP